MICSSLFLNSLKSQYIEMGWLGRNPGSWKVWRFFQNPGILKKVGGRFVLSDDWLVFLLWGVPLVAWFGLVAKLRFLCLFLCEVLGRVMCLGV